VEGCATAIAPMAPAGGFSERAARPAADRGPKFRSRLTKLQATQTEAKPVPMPRTSGWEMCDGLLTGLLRLGANHPSGLRLKGSARRFWC
jgi:hypothetical protein